MNKIVPQGFFDIITQEINIIFSVLIVVVFFLGCLFSRFRSNAPSLMVSIGITGTFIGIFYSLIGLDFSPEHMNQSVYKLIGGMQTAFYTSLLGMVGSIVFIVMRIIFSKSSKSAEETTAGDINYTLEEISKNIKDLKNSLVGDDETSLSTQLVKLRQENRDGFNDMKTTFTDFADKVSELGTKAIIKALEEVIRDFNNKLTEQFGENFKQLNKAVERLVEWQENYKKQVEVLTAEFENAQKGIKNTEKSIASIDEKASSITDSMKKLQEILKIVEKEINDLENRLEAFADMKDKATDAFPQINDNIKNLTTELKEKVSDISEGLKVAYNNANDNIEDLSKNMQKITFEAIKEMSDKTNEEISKSAESVQGTADQISNIGKSISETNDDISKIGDTVKTNSNEVIKNIEELSTKLQQELKSAMQNYAEQMEKQANENTINVQRNIEQTVQDAQTALEKTINSSFENFDGQMVNQINRTVQKMGNDLVSIMNEFEKTHNEIIDARDNS